MRQRFAAIELARNANVFGILVSTKKGQTRLELAAYAKKLLESKNKKAYMLCGREQCPNNLIGLKVDAFVNTACPRLALDDSLGFNKPILSVPELEILLETRNWEKYKIDSF